MKRLICLSLTLVLVSLAVSSAQAIDRSGFDELQKLVDSAKIMEVDVFAPKVWKKASDAYRKANEAILKRKDQKTVNKRVSEAREYTENGIKATEIAKLSLSEYLEPRDKAKTAKAPSLAGLLYNKAETQFKKATRKVEEGNVKNALKEAEKSRTMFDLAEIEAIKADIMGHADKLIAKAKADDAHKYGPSTFDKANSARAKANAILTNNRYSKDDAMIEAARAEYQARHASNIALAVRSLNRNDQAWEKLMLLYEIQMNRVGVSAEIETLPFDEGPLAAADTLIAYIKSLQTINELLSANMGDLSGFVSERIQAMLSRLEAPSTETDPVKLIGEVDKAIAALQIDKTDLNLQLASVQEELDLLKAQHEVTTAELATRTEREEKFRKAKQTLNPSEGEVLFNSSNDVVLRLSGLSFDSGKDQIKDEHIPLLEKVKGIIELFPSAQLMIEGHTDAQGDGAANITLSEKRAYAVMQYLRQSLLLPADRIRSMGYGADKPVASNQTADGRAKNRRIDIIIMQ